MGWLRKPWHLVAFATVAALVVIGTVVWQARRVLNTVHQELRDGATVAATIQPWAPAIPNLELIAAGGGFADVALFQQHLFVGGRTGLVEYDERGTVLSRRRPGIELPPGGVQTLTVATLAAMNGPELIIGTPGDGLLTYNGQRLLQARPADRALGSITATLPLESGRVLVGTATRGLLYFDGRQYARAPEDLSHMPVTALAGAEGDVWIGTTDRGVWHWHGGAVERFGERDGLPDARVLSLVTHQGRTYVGTAVGIAEFVDGHFTRALGTGLFASAITVRGDRLLVGTMDGSLAEIPLTSRGARASRPLLSDAPAPVIRFANGADRLIALSADAIYTIGDSATAVQAFSTPTNTALSDRNISALSVDANGRLWVGYFDRGLDILSSDGQRVAHVENDHVFCVNRIVQGAAGGQTAVATANGLVLFDAAGQPRQVLGRAQGLIADHVTDLVASGRAMTVATPAGLTFLDDGGSRSIYAFQGLINNHVYALAADGADVFAGTLGGASMIERGFIRTSYTTANSALTHNWITAVVRVDHDWFAGTYGGSVQRLDANGNWHRFDDLASGLEINPNAMIATPTHVFAGSLTKGLLVYDRGTARWRTVDTGLPSHNVTALAWSPRGLYVGTDNGLARFAPDAFDRP